MVPCNLHRHVFISVHPPFIDSYAATGGLFWTPEPSVNQSKSQSTSQFACLSIYWLAVSEHHRPITLSPCCHSFPTSSSPSGIMLGGGDALKNPSIYATGSGVNERERERTIARNSSEVKSLDCESLLTAHFTVPQSPHTSFPFAFFIESYSSRILLYSRSLQS